MSGGLYAALGVYIQTYFWGLSANNIATLTAGNLVGVILAFVIVLPLSKSFGKKWTTLVLYMITLIAMVAPILLNLAGLFPGVGHPLLMPLLFIFAMIVAAAVIAAAILNVSMVADVIEQIELSTGRQSEGLIFSATSMVNKTISGMGVLASGFLLTLVGFPDDAKPGAVDIATVNHLALYFVLAIMFFTLAALLSLTFYPVTRSDHQSAVDELARRRATNV